MHFIQEAGFTFAVHQIEPKFPCSDELLRQLEVACWLATCIGPNWHGAVRLSWKGAPLIAWYCRTGETIFLRSVS